MNDINNKNKPTLSSTKEVDIVAPETSKKTVKKIDKKPVTKVKPPLKPVAKVKPLLKEKVEKPTPKVTHKEKSTIQSKKGEIVLTDIASMKKLTNHKLHTILKDDDENNFEKMKKIDKSGIQYMKKRAELDIENSNSKISMWLTVFVSLLTAILTTFIAITNLVPSITNLVPDEKIKNSLVYFWESLNFFQQLLTFYFLLGFIMLGVVLVAYFMNNSTSQKLLLLIEEYQLLHK